MQRRNSINRALLCSGATLLGIAASVAGGDLEAREELRLLKEQNKALQEQLTRQQDLIETLNRKVNRLEQVKEGGVEEAGDAAQNSESGNGGFSLGKVRISGEGGVGLFHTGSEGMFPNTEFRVDEAKLFVEAPIWGEAYFFTEINLATREYDELDVRLGELYLDVENISRLWGQERQLSLRLGRMDIPFGEEYMTRDAIDNPLISHSLADLWGVDEGLELYGGCGKWNYVVAVQNGGVSGGRDFHADKSVSGRIGWDPTRWLHLSISGMRTGDLDARDDRLSEMWFGNGWFRSIGSSQTTKFGTELVEGDIGIKLPHGHLKAFGGYIHYDDDDPLADNQRDVYYYSAEGVYNVTRRLYGAARFSQIFARNGFPIVGNGSIGKYLFRRMAEEVWRVSVGLGCHWSPNLVVKAEYTVERGKEPDGTRRLHHDLFGVEAAFRF